MSLVRAAAAVIGVGAGLCAEAQETYAFFFFSGKETRRSRGRKFNSWRYISRRSVTRRGERELSETLLDVCVPVSPPIHQSGKTYSKLTIFQGCRL